MKILIIDDDPGTTDLLQLVLEPLHADTMVANSAQDGIALARNNYFNLILLDLMMPEIDGWEVCRTIRSFSDTPILILSALDNPQMIADALDAGGDDFLTKPATNSILLANIQKLLRRAAIETTTAVRRV